MRLANAARSPQVEIVSCGVKMPGSFIREPVARRHFVPFEGELPIRLFASQKLNEIRMQRTSAPLFLALIFQRSQASRTDSACKLTPPDACSGQRFAGRENGWNPLPRQGP